MRWTWCASIRPPFTAGTISLIHNSPWLKEAGYYYHGFDAREGAAQLQRAAVDHASGLDDYRTRSQRVFAAVDPFSQRNLDAYAARLLHLCRDAHFANTASRR
jgi:hypothetical protein